MYQAKERQYAYIAIAYYLVLIAAYLLMGIMFNKDGLRLNLPIAATLVLAVFGLACAFSPLPFSKLLQGALYYLFLSPCLKKYYFEALPNLPLRLAPECQNSFYHRSADVLFIPPAFSNVCTQHALVFLCACRCTSTTFHFFTAFDFVLRYV